MFKEIKINWVEEKEIGSDGALFQFQKSSLRKIFLYFMKSKNNIILSFINTYLQTECNDYIKIQIKSSNYMLNTFIPNSTIYIILIGGKNDKTVI